MMFSQTTRQSMSITVRDHQGKELLRQLFELPVFPGTHGAVNRRRMITHSEPMVTLAAQTHFTFNQLTAPKSSAWRQVDFVHSAIADSGTFSRQPMDSPGSRIAVFPIPFPSEVMSLHLRKWSHISSKVVESLSWATMKCRQREL